MILTMASLINSAKDPAMNTSNPSPVAGTAAKVGGWLFALWSVLHIWVGAEGVHQYLTGGTTGLWNMLIGGRAVPRAAFVHATDPVTLFAQGQLILNFCLDVGGYGVLGLFVAWLIIQRASWTGYLIGLLAIGIADLAFLFAMVLAGVIEFNAGTLGGPVLWFLAVLITPFGLPSWRRA
jgi:hypothetical protein